MSARAEVCFYGRVQGVYFRDYTRRFAVPLGITGWVMNLPDGSVKAIFEGEKENIQELIRKLRFEHPSAHVDGMSISWSEGKRLYADFQIRHS